MNIRPLAGSVLLLISLMGCGETKEPESPSGGLPEGAQTVSLLGDTLYPPPLDDEEAEEYEARLKEAEQRYEASPDSADTIIWYGRRLAYLGEIREAVNVFTKGISTHPEDPRMYRHRGHRYITLRDFESAIEDLEEAAKLIRGAEDEIEPDGLPNKLDIPLTTLHFNVWYHLGLAYYLDGDLRNAERVFRESVKISENDDTLVSGSYWLYLSLKQQGREKEAEEVLAMITDDLEMIENEVYYRLLLMFKEEINPEIVIKRSEGASDNATMGYGLAWWHRFNGQEDEAVARFKEVVSSPDWTSFGYIAAEVQLSLIQSEDGYLSYKIRTAN